MKSSNEFLLKLTEFLLGNFDPVADDLIRAGMRVKEKELAGLKLEV